MSGVHINSYLGDLSQASIEQLENGVNFGVQLLESLKIPLATAPANTQASKWLEAIQQLQDKAKPARTVIGVVGNTGAGESSVINAILDEEKIVDPVPSRSCNVAQCM